MKTGQLLYIEGKLRTSSYEDKETGAKKYFTDVQCQNFRFLGSPPSDDKTRGTDTVSKETDTSANKDSNHPPMPEPEDDLPF